MAATLLLFIVIRYGEASVCDVKIAYIGQTTGSEMVYMYRLFNGKESQTVFLEDTQSIEIETASETQYGGLRLIVKDPDGTILYSEQIEETSDTTTLETPSTGFYRIIIQGSWTSGEYAVSWTVK